LALKKTMVLTWMMGLPYNKDHFTLSKTPLISLECGGPITGPLTPLVASDIQCVYANAISADFIQILYLMCIQSAQREEVQERITV